MGLRNRNKSNDNNKTNANKVQSNDSPADHGVVNTAQVAEPTTQNENVPQTNKPEGENSKKASRDELVEKARTQYGIGNADQMSDSQLKDEIKAIDGQPKTADKE